MPEDFDHFENASAERGRIDLDTPEGARMVVRFTMCGIYLQLKMLVLMPILEASVWATIRQQSLAYSDEMRVLANECVAAALAMVSDAVGDWTVQDGKGLTMTCHWNPNQLHAFERYYLAIPHLTEVGYISSISEGKIDRISNSYIYQQLSLSAILLLYAISIIYMDILRLPQEEAIATYSSVVRTMSNILDHYDHPAAHVAQVSGPVNSGRGPLRETDSFICPLHSRPCVMTSWRTSCNAQPIIRSRLVHSELKEMKGHEELSTL
jgi:hypothetical protein